MRISRLIFTLGSGMMLAIASSAWAQPGNYELDAAHSLIGFEVSHLQISKTRGAFNDVKGSVTYDPGNPAATTITATIAANSIDTRNEKRDEHLRSDDFLAAAEHPQITFQSTAVDASGKTLTVTGDLTIRGVTQSVTLPLTLTGPIESPFGGKVIGLAGQTTIDRQDFGVNWNKTLDQGGVVVGNDVLIDINVEAMAK